MVFSCALVVALVFVAAAVLKISSPRSFIAELSDYSILPDWIVPAAAVALPVAELSGAATLAFPGTQAIGVSVLIALLVLFSAAVIRNLVSGRTTIACACFGKASNELGWAIPARNLAMALPLVALLLVGPTAQLTAAGCLAAVLAALVVTVLVEMIKVTESSREVFSD